MKPAKLGPHSLLAILGFFWLPACSVLAEQSDPAASIYEHTWQLQHSQQGSIGLTLSDARPPFTLKILPDGTAQGVVACNRWSAQARVSPELLRLERVISSRARCNFDDRRVAALSGRYLNALQAAAQYEIVDEQLHITLQNDEIWRFERPE